jgi:ATP-dependent protease HslVU (ClpYQ) peptidase subunit
MGADSCASIENQVNERYDKKVWIKEDKIYGFCGSFRVGQLMRYAFQAPERSKNSTPLEYMVTHFVDSLTKTLEAGGALLKDEQQERAMPFESMLMVGYDGCLYIISYDFAIEQIPDGYAAIGSGEPYALGSLFETTNKKPQTRILSALQTASYHCAWVLPPYAVECLKSPTF